MYINELNFEISKFRKQLHYLTNYFPDKTSPELKHRKVKHFGYEFRYDTNKVDPKDPIEPIPRDFHFLQTLFEKNGCGKYVYDQLTINRYLPGQGILQDRLTNLNFLKKKWF